MQPNRPATASGWRNAGTATSNTTASLRSASANTGRGAMHTIARASRTNTASTIASAWSASVTTRIADTSATATIATAMPVIVTSTIGATRVIAMIEIGSTRTTPAIEITTAKEMTGITAIKETTGIMTTIADNQQFRRLKQDKQKATKGGCLFCFA